MAELSPDPILPRKTWAAWLGWLGLGLILILGARARLQWPLVPLSDEDTWGYLHPALSALIGQGFQHTDGRNFVYPGWVYLWLRSCGDFRAIAIAQHALGLATGVLLWRVWEQWLKWFSRPRLPGWITALAGLALVAFYECSTTVIFLEHRIRPEAIFPFFALLAIYLTLKFLRAWLQAPRPTSGAVWGAALVFDGVLCYQLKPSFGFALGVALLPLLAAGLKPGQTSRRRLVLAGAAAAGMLLALLFLLWPEHALAQPDSMSTLFLPETLLSAHARIIRDQMAEDLAAGDPTPYPASWLAALHARLEHEIAVASLPEHEPYESLGFSPDYLIYQDSFCHGVSQEMGSARFRRLAFYYYARSWWHQPAAMARNVGRQLGLFYGRECLAFWTGRQIDEARNYRKTVTLFERPSFQAQMLAYPPARQYLAEARRLGSLPAVYLEPAWFTRANLLAAELHLPLLAALGAGLLLLLSGAGVRRELGPAGWLVLLCFGYTFGNCLTVAVVHSLDIVRYSWNLVIFTLLSEAAAAVWCIEGLLCAWARLYPKLSNVPSRSHVHAARQ